MKRRRLIRLQLILLVTVTGLLIWRSTSGPPTPEGLVVLTNLETGQLRQASFVLEQPTPLVVEAAGSVERLDGQAVLAAYGWILNRDTREVVWRLIPGQIDLERETLVEVADPVELPAGTYDVYYTAMGNSRASRQRGALDRIFKVRLHWENDEDAWKMVVRPADMLSDGMKAYGLDGVALDDMAPRHEGLIWTSAPMRSRRTQSHLFEVTRPTMVHLYAVGEFCEEACDHGWIEDAMTGEHVWEMTRENTELAGGRRENRLFQGDLLLPPGVYRAAFDTDRGHAYGDWTGNPPYDPTAWGLSIWTDAPEGSVAAFDPWSSREPFLRLTEVPDDVLRSTQFVVQQPVQMMAYAVGEISTGGSLYDYAWVENDDTATRIWEMSRDSSQPAGGSEKNRLEIAFLSLEPATYTVYYQTDGSHAYNDWNEDPPDHPERWGVTLFTLSAAPDTGALHIIEPTRPARNEPSVGGNMPPIGSGEMLVRQVGLGNEMNYETTIELDGESRLHIKAVGEMSHSGRYDYGWIEREDTGETVWEMTMQNTAHAGGDDRNRLFDGIITLPGGRYKVRFKTDFSHAYGDFDEGGPTNPRDWGIVVERITR